MIHKNIAVLSIIAVTSNAMAQQPSAPLPPTVNPQPHWVSLSAEIIVNRPAKAVWARVGKFCDVGEWLQYSCHIIAGKDGELGAVRVVHDTSIEMLAGKTDLSYTYVMPVRVGIPYNAAHSTVEARPLTARRTRLIYSQLYDNSLLADETARATDLELRRNRLSGAVRNMKIVAEGGKLTPR